VPLLLRLCARQNLKDLIEGLLKFKPAERLGIKDGIKEIKNHSFFKEINWTALRNRQTQSFMTQPLIQVELNFSNFDIKYTELSIDIDITAEKIKQTMLRSKS
jgi:hypothetical protein